MRLTRLRLFALKSFNLATPFSSKSRRSSHLARCCFDRAPSFDLHNLQGWQLEDLMGGFLYQLRAGQRVHLWSQGTEKRKKGRGKDQHPAVHKPGEEICTVPGRTYVRRMMFSIASCRLVIDAIGGSLITSCGGEAHSMSGNWRRHPCHHHTKP